MHFLVAFCFLFGISSTVTQRCKRQVPENRHGIQPIVITNKAEAVQQNNLKKTLPILSPEWEVELNLTMNANHVNTGIPGGDWCSVFHMTKGDELGSHGDRTPAIYHYKVDGKIWLFSSVGNDFDHSFNRLIEFNNQYHIKISQRYKNGGVYEYSIEINGEKVHAVDNLKARQFYGVKVYLGNPWKTPCVATISYMNIVNFL
ncbi:uncharacterized protein [Clytia hemisphaerica]|uniref:uncharacterized protein n=1 Tax=Clytia hemisphaerica TaxID=252671 RepID=UPI0034D58BF1